MIKECNFISVSRTCWLQFCCNMPQGPLFSAHRGMLLLRSFISSSNQGGTPKNGSIISTFNWSALHPTWTNYSTWICSKTVQPTECAEKPFGTPKTMHDSTIFWCLIDGQVTPPLSPHGHEMRALQQLWEQKEVLSLWCICKDIIFWCFFVSFLLFCCNDIFWPIFWGEVDSWCAQVAGFLAASGPKALPKLPGTKFDEEDWLSKKNVSLYHRSFFFVRSFFFFLLLLLLLLLFKAWFCCTQGEASAKSCWTFSRSIAGSYTSGRELSDLKITTGFGEFC